MATLHSYKTADSSKKITTYVLDTGRFSCGLDFGSNDIPLNEVKRLQYIFITHEHSDHFMGLYNPEYARELLKSKCKIYASNVTKDLIIAIFENTIKVSLDERDIKPVRDLLNRISGELFFEKIKLSEKDYFKLFPSGHTYGSSMIYLNTPEIKIFYTGDIDYSSDDEDRQYKLDFEMNETTDYVIVDGTYLDSEGFKDEEFSRIRNNILNRGFNNFLCKPEKMIFFSKKLMSDSKLIDKYCMVVSCDYKWYLEILKKYNYDPFINDVIVLDSSIYNLPENRTHLSITSKREEKQQMVSGLVGLHIRFLDLAYMLQLFDPEKTKVLVGHYNSFKENSIIQTFRSSDLTCYFDVKILKEGQLEL